MHCRRHLDYKSSQVPWKGILLCKDLDSAINSFYSKTLDRFIKSWFSLLSTDYRFIHSLKQGVRTVSYNIISRYQFLNFTELLTNKLLPMFFKHTEIVQDILKVERTIDKFPNHFIRNGNQCHPAVINRASELSYLRTVSKFLIIKSFNVENFESKIFFTLIRELIACWILRPFMDVISDPNLINLMVINVYKKKNIKKRLNNGNTKVEFLRNFVKQKEEKLEQRNNENLLNDKNQLYLFMQFLKKEGAVDVLRFYMDVDNLNQDLLDSNITTDPVKLSLLHQQSEKLLQDYRSLDCDNEFILTECTLTEAYERIGTYLEKKWKKLFYDTPEYFKSIYGKRNVTLQDSLGNVEHLSTSSRISSKLKDVIRGSINGAPLEVTEIPTVWDSLVEAHVNLTSPKTYCSVTQKIRKERGQNLELFIIAFIKSLDHRLDMGEDVAKFTKGELKHLDHFGNVAFNDLFEVSCSFKSTEAPHNISYSIEGPSECVIYTLSKIMKVPLVIIRLVCALISISKKMMDIILGLIINRVINSILLKTPLSVLIQSLEDEIFRNENIAIISAEELLQRQKRAREILEQICFGTGHLLDTFQNPVLNKHLMYCFFDTFLQELYPELKK